MKKLSTLKIVITVILIACFGLVAVFGFDFAGYQIKSAKDSINLGLDLAGGVYVDVYKRQQQQHLLMVWTKNMVNTRSWYMT